MRQDADPVRFGAEVVGVPVPILDHFSAAGHEGPCRLPPLPLECREVGRRSADRPPNPPPPRPHCPSNAGKLVDDPPIAPALVSVIKNGACLEAYIRSAEKNRLHAPEVVQPCRLTLVLGTASASCMAEKGVLPV